MIRHCFSSGCRRFWYLGALCLAFESVGCQFVFGDFTIQPDQIGSGGAAEAGGASSTGGANNGTAGATTIGPCDGSSQYSCSGSQILACVAGAWQIKDTCSKASYCNTTTGVCDKCSLGDAQCDAPTDFGTQLSTCDDPTVGFTPGVTCVAPSILFNNGKPLRCVREQRNALCCGFRRQSHG
jgi:hypothetical protein